MKLLSPLQAAKLTRPGAVQGAAVTAAAGGIPWGKLRDTGSSALSTLLTTAAGATFSPNKRRVFVLANGDLIVFSATAGRISTLGGSTGTAVAIAAGDIIADVAQSQANRNVFLAATQAGKIHRVVADSAQNLSATLLESDFAADTTYPAGHWRTLSLSWDEALNVLIVAYLRESGSEFTAIAALYTVGTGSLTFRSASAASVTLSGPSIATGPVALSATRRQADGKILYAAATGTTGSPRLGAAIITHTATTVTVATPGVQDVGSFGTAPRLSLHDALAVMFHSDNSVSQLAFEAAWAGAGTVPGTASAYALHGADVAGGVQGDTFHAASGAALRGQAAGLPIVLEHLQDAGFNGLCAVALADGAGLAFADTDGTDLRLRLLRATS